MSQVVERYHRTIDPDGTDSLARLVRWVRPGSTVLDIGTATGALGRYLTEERGCRVDGIERDRAAAELAAPGYRQLVIGDLEENDLWDQFAAGTYDYVVLADVLEHVRSPVTLLRQAADLVTAEGRLLLSMPNFSYGPVVAELLCGRLRYRSTGILDETHLRFVTRDSFLAAINDAGLGVLRLDRVIKLPHESEFGTLYLEALPAAVRSFVEATEDASTYQFLAEVAPKRPGAAGGHFEDWPSTAAQQSWPMPLKFAITLRWRGPGERYDSSREIVAYGVVGGGEQKVELRFPEAIGQLGGLHLVLADRPGILELRALKLQDALRGTIWSWDTDVRSIASAPHERLVICAPRGQRPGALLAFSAEQPLIELPIPESVLGVVTGGSSLEVELVWPAAPDYMVLLDRVKKDFGELERTEARVAQLTETLNHLSGMLDDRLQLVQDQAQTIHDLERDRDELQRSVEECTARLKESEDRRGDMARPLEKPEANQ